MPWTRWLLCWCLGLTLNASADYLDDIGFRALQAAGVVPTGASVRIDQIEASTAPVEAEPVYRADPSNPGFSGVTFVDVTQGPSANFSGHANGVALLFAGNGSMTSGVATVDSYEANDWLIRVLFNGGIGDARPVLGTGILANHSWVGAATEPSDSAELLTRLDWLINADDTIQVVGVTNATNPLLSNAYNVLGVSRSGNQAFGLTTALDGFYRAGRVLPHIVAPHSTVSNATPTVTSAVALLQDSAPATPLNAALVKAIVMAGADRVTRNTSAANLDTFTPSTGNGLDPRYGAGQLNVLQIMQIRTQVASGSAEQGGGTVSLPGYAYQADFGGADGAPTIATYQLPPLPYAGFLQTTLSWHAHITATSSGTFIANARHVYNFNLSVIDAANTTLAASSSTIDNTETIGVWLAAGQSYRLRVTSVQSPAVHWPYALAWRLEADRDGDRIFDKHELSTCPAADDADSDDDGISDHAEDSNNDGILGATESDPCAWDSDGDGLSDGLEAGVAQAVPDPDGAGPLRGTAVALFQADLDPTTTTALRLADTDGDGVQDGVEDANRNGRIDTGESDPNNGSSVPPSVKSVPMLPAAACLALAVCLAFIATQKLRRRHQLSHAKHNRGSD